MWHSMKINYYYPYAPHVTFDLEPKLRTSRRFERFELLQRNFAYAYSVLPDNVRRAKKIQKTNVSPLLRT